MTIEEFVKKHNITVTCEQVDSNPNMDDFAGDHYKVHLRRPIPGREHPAKSRMRTHFSKGYGHRGKPPTAEEVLECLLSDSLVDTYITSFEEWAEDYGYSTDSRKAERVYNAILKQNKKLKAFLGEELFEELQTVEL